MRAAQPACCCRVGTAADRAAEVDLSAEWSIGLHVTQADQAQIVTVAEPALGRRVAATGDHAGDLNHSTDGSRLIKPASASQPPVVRLADLLPAVGRPFTVGN
jgi:hypothetical protein